jgi:hypothetical protein
VQGEAQITNGSRLEVESIARDSVVFQTDAP